MSNKQDFSSTIISLDNGLSFSSMTDCERYGITWGCDEDCPIYQEGKCELQKENEKQFRLRSKL